MRVKAGAVWFGLGVLFSAHATADEPAASEEPFPDMELLEYLGDLVEDHERWVGPDDMRGTDADNDSRKVLDVEPDAQQVNK
jgi:hypothetical protein